MERLTERYSENGVKLIKENIYEPFVAQCLAYHRLADFEDMICDRTFWVIASSYGADHAAPVKIKEIAKDGTFTCTWQVTDEYSEDIEEIDVTDLFHTQAEAESQIERDTLKKALELICAHQSIQQWGLNTAQKIYDYFIQQAQEQEGNK